MIVEAACAFDNTECVHRAQVMFHRWMNNTQVTLNPDYRMTVYCTVVHNGGYEEWDFVRKQLNRETNDIEKQYLRFDETY